MALQTEFSFTLPKGYVDREGRLHRNGTMRLATARDEIEPLRDPNIGGPDDPYLTILVIARVVTELGLLSSITTEVIEDLFAADLAFLQDLYGIINFGDPADAVTLQASVLPPEPIAPPAPTPVVESAASADAAERPDGAFDDEEISFAPRRRGVIEEVRSQVRS